LRGIAGGGGPPGFTHKPDSRHSRGEAQASFPPQTLIAIQYFSGGSMMPQGPPNTAGRGLANSDPRAGVSSEPQVDVRVRSSKQSENLRQTFSSCVQAESSAHSASTQVPPITPRHPSGQFLGASFSHFGPL
jgi:hypothetical protein